MSVVYQPSQTTHWKNLFASKTMLLGSHNLNEGEELVCQIQSVAMQEIKNTSGKKENVPVCNFFNAPPMVLNITNTRTIASLYGDNYEGWTNQHIQVFATSVKAFGQQQMALRVRQVIPSVGEDTSGYEHQLRGCKSMSELQDVFMAIPKHLKNTLAPLKNEMKGKLNA
ncbi:hypothetical protein NVP1029O_48 [Vibrio phage 1.029.O._10N.261.55.A7]|nr:hypothetical protein NVP1029O_48 [Vibrio phage 1.029.O._10N.261.55.A7]